MTAEDELLRLLDDAAAVVVGYGEMKLCCGFDTAAEFAAELRSLRERVARQDWSALGPLVGIFAPTGAWDDGVGAPGMHLANSVIGVLDRMEWSRRTGRCT
ncbi:MAG: hypothetical protein K1X57_09175 [Gemmataceae bacterium]|nr:hypothetical protein [Gemmataceae bacterium]